MFADEAAFCLLPTVVKTWARVGQTPVLRTPTTHEHLSVASAITMDGRLITQIREHAFKGEDVVRFLKHLLRQIPGKIVLLWDGATIHRCKAVKQFLSEGAAERLRLIRLPAYAPELNPDEGVWRWTKRQLGNVCCPNKAELKNEVRRVFRKLRRRPEIIQACFDEAGLPI